VSEANITPSLQDIPTVVVPQTGETLPALPNLLVIFSKSLNTSRTLDRMLRERLKDKPFPENLSGY
jgi:hypothetical protein